MSIWRRIIGEATRLAIDGPLGALVQALGGAERASFAGDRPDGTTGRIAFTIGVIALSAKMAKADGAVTPDEVLAFKEVFHIPPDEMRNVERVFNLARRDTAGYEQYARQIARLFRDDREVLQNLMHGLFHIATADCRVHPAELDYLATVARIFGLSEAEFACIRAYYLGPDKSDPYLILGIACDADDDAVKRAYRHLVRENHPDRAIARGLPAEFVALANDKLARINDAYAMIAQQRGLS